MDTGTSRPAWFVLSRHWLSLTGAALVTTAGISWLFILPLNMRGHVQNPYVGIVLFLILPAIFFTGLALIPIGIYLGKRQIQQGLADTAVDRRTALRRLAWFFAITTFASILDRHSGYLSRGQAHGNTAILWRLVSHHGS